MYIVSSCPWAWVRSRRARRSAFSAWASSCLGSTPTYVHTHPFIAWPLKTKKKTIFRERVLIGFRHATSLTHAHARARDSERNRQGRFDWLAIHGIYWDRGKTCIIKYVNRWWVDWPSDGTPWLWEWSILWMESRWCCVRRLIEGRENVDVFRGRDCLVALFEQFVFTGIYLEVYS